ncbi:MAG TPA: hypothetical protein VGR06_17395 [Actinophytocola sp.]|uniref:type IV pilus assembly protein FimV n=1 Tax=Actinophytocola sp. TaxID=1872138 RepID=UPI002E048435|nr:hypothetical protein [Actinophytocola sp.]
MNRRRIRIIAIAAGVLLVSAVTTAGQAPAAPDEAVQPGVAVASSVTAQPTLAKDYTPAAQLAPDQLALMRAKLDAAHDAMAANTKPIPGKEDPAAAAGKASPSTFAPVSGPSVNAPGDLIIGRNNQNTVANTNLCGTGSTLAEPAAANEGPNVYYTGNLTHQEFSITGGTLYLCAGAYPAGPVQAPNPFGDTDVIYDHARGVTFHSVIYVNAGLTDGVIGINVRNNINGADNCTYFIDFDPGGTVIPDYPHLGLSNDFVYFNANRVDLVNGVWLGATIERLSADSMAACLGAGGNIITFTNPGGQRILVPGHGARDVMYLAWVDTTTQWRVFSWADNSATVFSTFVAVGTMTFGATDCRGGVGNVNWHPSTSIVGFPVRVTFGNDFVHAWAEVSNDAGHTHAYIQGAQFRVGAAQNALTLVQQPQLFFTDRCAGSPNFGANDRGDLGYSVAIGGANGGGGPAVAPCVGMKDQFNPGPGGFFCILTVGATHNPTRFGDYFTVRRQAPCGEYFAATGYGFSGGTALGNVVAVYTEFGRGRDQQCYLAWRNSIPAT